ncbi:amino acid adenylation domain-containing protein [Phaeovulum sp. W22_SRMD_FR3]|uniref:amino acid adenylation domain-containing protein n=1 Tax=Phaeovulum sp. W22_SRMD_FR3 TaxID=3240274 RepID=UPI003F95B12B
MTRDPRLAAPSPATWDGSPRPLTEAQQGLWTAQALDPANPILNTGQYITLTGPLDLPAFRTAMTQMLAETAALRLRFGLRDGVPSQWLAPELPALREVDLTALREAEARATALAQMQADTARATDLAADPVAAFTLFRLSPTLHLWYERIHHLATDGYAMVLITNRIGALYSAQVEGQPAPSPIPPLERAFDEDAAYRNSPRRAEDAAFWQAEMAGLGDVTGPVPGRALTAHHHHRARRDLPAELRHSLTARAQTLGLGWPDVLTTLTGAYVARFLGSTEPVIGVPYMARMGSKAARVPAMLMNVLPLRLALPDAPLDVVLTANAARLAEGRKHGRYRSEQLRRDLGRTALDQRLYGPMVNVQPFDMPPVFSGLQADLHILGAGAVDDLTLTFRGDATHSLLLEVDANPRLYDAETTEAHADRLIAFLTRAAVAESLADVPTATPEEAERHVFTLNATEHRLPAVTLTELITAQMRATPSAPAVTFGTTTLTYAELDRRSAALAAELRALGVGPGKLVAVALPRSEHLPVALIAVLRAGGAYLPLDPETPAERLTLLAHRAAPVAILCATGFAIEGTDIPHLSPDLWAREGAAPDPGTTPQDLAYVLYTSGSTGEPKGVMIEHQAIVNRLLWMRDHYGFTAQDRILQKTPATFDVSVWEFFLPALCGACLVLAAPGAHRDPAEIARLIREEGITTLHFVPSMLSAFLAAPGSAGLRLTRVFCSGEELTADHRARFHARLTAELHNLYGPTEAAVDVSYWPATPEDVSAPLPIGWPVWNTRLYVLDAQMRPVPPGVAGQLYLGGVQLARGYLGRDDLTAERFLPDPFRPGDRIYATGDLARWRPDGAVVYLGRNDHQVKIRGIRIELGEIEAAILATGLVRDTVVVAREDRAGDRKLVAYLVPGPGFSPEAFATRLTASLPGHMIPAAQVLLGALPLSPNGKLERRALPAPVFDEGTGAPPEGATEQQLADLFAETLGLAAPPHRSADFFALGGDSLLALRLMLRIEEVFGRDPGLGSLFERPTVAGLAAVLAAGEAAASGLAPLMPLSPETAGAPLVLIHPAGGLGWCYRGLAQALPGRAVWTLQAPLLQEGGDLPASIETLAEDYAHRLTGAFPEGILHLAGWSVGGILAQAVAVRLRALGRQVGLLALLDAYPADVWRDEPEPGPARALRALLAIAGHDPEAHPELDSRAAVVGFLRQSGTALGALPETVLDGVVRVVTGSNRLVRQHHHARYDGRLTHIRADLDHAGRDLTAALWAPYAAEVEAMGLPVLHAGMVSPEACARLAPALARRMAEAEADG